MEDLFDIDEAATFTRTPKSTLYHLRCEGRGPKAGKIGRRLYYRKQDCIDWMNEQLAEKTA